MFALSPTESRVVPYVAYFSSNISVMLLAYERKTRPVARSSLHPQVSLSASQSHHLHISRGGHLKDYSLSPFFRVACGASGLQYAKIQWKGQGTLINFT